MRDAWALERYPVFRVTAITHREGAVYPATIVGILPMEDFYIGGASVFLTLRGSFSALTNGKHKWVEGCWLRCTSRTHLAWR